MLLVQERKSLVGLRCLRPLLNSLTRTDLLLSLGRWATNGWLSAPESWCSRHLAKPCHQSLCQTQGQCPTPQGVSPRPVTDRHLASLDMCPSCRQIDGIHRRPIEYPINMFPRGVWTDTRHTPHSVHLPCVTPTDSPLIFVKRWLNSSLMIFTVFSKFYMILHDKWTSYFLLPFSQPPEHSQEIGLSANLKQSKWTIYRTLEICGEIVSSGLGIPATIFTFCCCITWPHNESLSPTFTLIIISWI